MPATMDTPGRLWRTVTAHAAMNGFGLQAVPGSLCQHGGIATGQF